MMHQMYFFRYIGKEVETYCLWEAWFHIIKARDWTDITHTISVVHDQER